jgi:hypothetical protein
MMDEFPLTTDVLTARLRASCAESHCQYVMDARDRFTRYWVIECQFTRKMTQLGVLRCVHPTIGTAWCDELMVMIPRDKQSTLIQHTPIHELCVGRITYWRKNKLSV